MRFISVLFVLLFVCSRSALAWETHYDYDVYPIKKITGRYHEPLMLERAHVPDNILPVGIERIQFRNQEGRVVAYTSTRLTAVPFCLHRNACWVFMWKTVYPLPAVYKFNPDPQSWTDLSNSPMQYSRRGNWGEGFDAKLNPVFGFLGVLLLLKYRAVYFCTCVLLSIVLTLQIVKFHDLPDVKKEWVRRLLFIVFGLTPLPIPVSPYTITAFLIMLLTWGWGISYVGVPFVVSIFVVITTFFLCAVRLARMKTQ